MARYRPRRSRPHCRPAPCLPTGRWTGNVPYLGRLRAGGTVADCTSSWLPRTRPGGSVPPSPEATGCRARAAAAGPARVRRLPAAASWRPGVTITDFALQIPDVSFPFNVSGGRHAVPAQEAPLRLPRARGRRGADRAARSRSAAGQLAGSRTSSSTSAPATSRAQARLKAPERAAAHLQGRLRRRRRAARGLPLRRPPLRLLRHARGRRFRVLLSARGAASWRCCPRSSCAARTASPPACSPSWCQLAAVSRGYKMPALDEARLSAARGLPAGPAAALLLRRPAAARRARRGAAAHARGRARLRRRRGAGRRRASSPRPARRTCKLGDAHEAHPFAAERLLALLVADPQAHELRARRRRVAAAPPRAQRHRALGRGRGARAPRRVRPRRRALPRAVRARAQERSEEAAAFFAAEAAARAARRPARRRWR